MTSKTKAGIALVLLLDFLALLLNLVLADSSYGSLMFTSPRLNILALVVMLLLPGISHLLLSQAISPSRSHSPLRSRFWAWGNIALIFASLICLVLGILVISANTNTLRTDQPLDGYRSKSWLICSVPAADPPVRLYLLKPYNSPNHCFMQVQQERPILPGLIWATPLYREDDADRATAEALDPHHIHCHFSAVTSRCCTDTIVVENP